MAAVLCVVLVAWMPVDAGAQERRVVVVGDSIILGAEAPMTAAFAQRGWAVTFDAAVSRSTGAGLQAIESHRAELSDSLVVSLGANDAGSPAAFRQRVQAILDATVAVPHVYWVTLREVRDYYAPANQIVRELAAGRSNVTVLDWHGATAGAADLTAGDGLHLNGAGAARMTQLVTEAVVSGVVLPAAPPQAAAAPAPGPVAESAPPSPEPAPTTVAPATSAPSATSPSTTGSSDDGAISAARRSGPDEERAAAPVADIGSDRGIGGPVILVAGLLLVGLLVIGAAMGGRWLALRQSRRVPLRSSELPPVPGEVQEPSRPR